MFKKPWNKESTSWMEEMQIERLQDNDYYQDWIMLQRRMTGKSIIARIMMLMHRKM